MYVCTYILMYLTLHIGVILGGLAEFLDAFP
jgi:hypothetical protein